MSREPDSERRLTEAERARLRAGVFASIDRRERRRRGTRLVLGAGALMAAGALALSTAGLGSTEHPGVGAIPVRCGADDGSGAATIAAAWEHDPRLVCAELWRRGELIGGARKPAPVGACAATGTDGPLVIVYADPARACGAPHRATPPGTFGRPTDM